MTNKVRQVKHTAALVVECFGERVAALIAIRVSWFSSNKFSSLKHQSGDRSIAQSSRLQAGKLPTLLRVPFRSLVLVRQVVQLVRSTNCFDRSSCCP